MERDGTIDVIRGLLSLGIFRAERSVIRDLCGNLGEEAAAECAAALSEAEFARLAEGFDPAASPSRRLAVIFAGPGAGKSAVTNYLFERLRLKWLVVRTTRELRLSENERIGDPFAQYEMPWEEFDRIADEDPGYIKTSSADSHGRRSKGYIVDLGQSRRLLNSGYYLVIHSWIWSEFLQRSSAFKESLKICLYVDHRSTVSRLTFRTLVEAREKRILGREIASAFPAGPGDTDVDRVLEALAALPDEGMYRDLLHRIELARETQEKYDSILGSGDLSCFDYIVDNSGDLVKAREDMLAILVADRYTRLPEERRILPEYFREFVSRAAELEAPNWLDRR